MANSLVTRLLFLSIFLGDDGTLAYWLVERSVVPRMDQAQRLVDELMGPIKAGLLCAMSFLVYQWNRLMGQLASSKTTSVNVVKKVD